MSSGTTSSVIVAGARTPMGRLLGSLKSFSGADLGGFAIKAALDRAGIGGDTTVESLAKLRPAFSKDGTITAGSSSQISDGAAAVVVMSKAKAEELGLEWLAEVGAHGNVAGPDNSLQSQPSRAIHHALGKAGLAVGDLDLIEINEAFAAVVLQSMRDLAVSPDIVNVNGGAIAIGHPIGASGARIALHLVHELRRH